MLLEHQKEVVTE